jgi:hypothetical protein
MANLRQVDVSLIDWETRLVLRALAAEMLRLQNLAESTQDEDIASDAGNDAIEAGLLLERLTSEATSVFGAQISNFKNDFS